MRHVERRRLHENSGDDDNEELRQVDDGQEKSMLASKALYAGVCTQLWKSSSYKSHCVTSLPHRFVPFGLAGVCLPFPCDHWSQDPVPFFDPPPCPC